MDSRIFPVTASQRSVPHEAGPRSVGIKGNPDAGKGFEKVFKMADISHGAAGNAGR